ncbi:MAG: hypothetical protein PHZ19_00420 [Candidatus Thermoplasmatota archaeon]|nr:hypothetical protein [Candidatus Thermoplasmatota archaeon]
MDTRLIGGAMLGGAAIAALYLYKRLVESGGNGGNGQDCVEGQRMCQNLVSYQCVGGRWVPGGDACSVPDENCIDGVSKCSNNILLRCSDGKWSPIRQCTATDCLGVTCNPKEFTCDENNTLYYAPACDPTLSPAKCVFTEYLPDAEQCQRRDPKYLLVKINGIATEVGGYPQQINVAPDGSCGKPGGWPWETSTRHPELRWTVTVLDQFRKPINGAKVSIRPGLAKSVIGFVRQGSEYMVDIDLSKTPYGCGVYDGVTDSDGNLTIRSFVCWNPAQGSFRVESFNLKAFHPDGKTYIEGEALIGIQGGPNSPSDRSCYGGWLDQAECWP